MDNCTHVTLILWFHHDQVCASVSLYTPSTHKALHQFTQESLLNHTAQVSSRISPEPSSIYWRVMHALSPYIYIAHDSSDYMKLLQTVIFPSFALTNWLTICKDIPDTTWMVKSTLMHTRVSTKMTMQWKRHNRRRYWWINELNVSYYCPIKGMLQHTDKFIMGQWIEICRCHKHSLQRRSW